VNEVFKRLTSLKGYQFAFVKMIIYNRPGLSFLRGERGGREEEGRKGGRKEGRREGKRRERIQMIPKHTTSIIWY